MKLTTWNGMTKNQREWAEYFGISERSFSYKKKDGVPFEDMIKSRRKGKPKGAKDLKPRKPGTGLWRNKR